MKLNAIKGSSKDVAWDLVENFSARVRSGRFRTPFIVKKVIEWYASKGIRITPAQAKGALKELKQLFKEVEE